MIDADLGLFEAQRQAGDAVAEVEHLVEHDVAEALDAGDAVADLADDADALLGVAVFAPAICASISCNQVGHGCTSTVCEHCAQSAPPVPPGGPTLPS